MHLSIRQKLFFLLSGLTIVVLVVVLLAVNATASRTLRQDVLADFKQTQGFFQIEQNLRYDRLVESAYLIQENSTFKANVQLNDPATVNQVVEQFALFIKADLFVVTNADGEVLSWLGNPQKTGLNLRDNRSTVRLALLGEEPPLNVQWPDLWAEGDVLYQVVTVPMYYGNALLGTITLGTQLTDEDARELAQNTPLDVIFFLDGSPIASSGSGDSVSPYDAFVSRNAGMIDSLLAKRLISDPLTHDLDGTERFSFVSPLGKGEAAFYVAGVPSSVELGIISDIQYSILLIAAIAIIIIIPLAIFLGRVLSRPVNRLTSAMARVEEGEFDVSVTPSSSDEIGQMTRSFNNMVNGLKERFALQKYVGGHTLSMIKNDADREAMREGSRRELAILFTDLRNSTEIIERSQPEQFVTQLNKCLAYQSESVIDFEGSIDKYVGDSMIALFDGEDALERAIKCGVTIQKKYKAVNSFDSFFEGIGIGINFGPMILGNMGGNERMDYTVIGPEVNLCARLCGAAGPGQILLPESSLSHISMNNTIRFKHLAPKKFKGFSERLNTVEVKYD